MDSYSKKLTIVTLLLVSAITIGSVALYNSRVYEKKVGDCITFKFIADHPRPSWEQPITLKIIKAEIKDGHIWYQTVYWLEELNKYGKEVTTRKEDFWLPYVVVPCP